MSAGTPSRRAVLAGILAAAASGLPSAAATPGLRIASLNWALVETLIALGHPPVGTVDTAGYDKWVREPALPAGVADLGSRFEPNLEALQRLRPDEIFIVPYQEGLRHLAERIAPVRVFDLYSSEGTAIERIHRVTRDAAAAVGRQEAAERLIAGAETRLDAVAARLAHRELPPVFVVNLLDRHHARVYGENCLIHEVMGRIGVENAWRGKTNYWGFAMVGLVELARLRDGRLVAMEPLPPSVSPELFRGPLWSRLPSVERHGYNVIAPVLMFGGVPSMVRFAELLEAALSPDAAG